MNKNANNFVKLNIEDNNWKSFVNCHPDAIPFHHPAWAKLISECYGYPAFVYALTDQDNQIQAGIPIIDFNSWLTGHRWVSLPYTDFCPPLSNNPSVLEQLLDVLQKRTEEQNIPYCEIRWMLPSRKNQYIASDFFIHTLDLSTDIDSIYKRFNSNHRRNLRKVNNRNIQVINLETKTEFDIFYKLQTQTRKRLGVPVQPKKFFGMFWDNIIKAGLGFVLITYYNQDPISGGVFLHFNDTVIYKYGATNENFWDIYPNKLLMWQAIKMSCELGYKILNFGNSPSSNQGLIQYKRGWGAIEEKLYYSYIGSSPKIKQEDGNKKIVEEIIRHSPSAICRYMGELFYKHFC